MFAGVGDTDVAAGFLSDDLVRTFIAAQPSENGCVLLAHIGSTRRRTAASDSPAAPWIL